MRSRNAAVITQRSPALTLLGIGMLVVLAALIHIGAGSSDVTRTFTLRMPPLDVLDEILRGPNQLDHAGNAIVWQLRLPRALACLCVGGVLGMVGSAFQAIFRNPLAEPYIVGASSGAAVGGAVAIAFGLGQLFGGLGVMAFAFAGGMGAITMVMSLARHRGSFDVQRLLLGGVVTGGFLSALLAAILLGTGQDANQILRWLLGSMSPMYWKHVAWLAGGLLLGGALLIGQSRRMNAFALGEDTAQRLGVPTRWLKPTILVTGTAMTSLAVGVVGVIGFLGLVAPHIARRVVGVDWRWSLIGSGLVGMLVLLFADVVAQWGIPGAEIQVGIVTAVIGAPALLVLLRREG